MAGQYEFEVPTWTQVYSMLLRQSERICSSGFRPDVIVGVSRGGWVPARVLSDLLDNPNLANLKVEYYLGIGETKESPLLTQLLSVDVAGKRVLVVDEVADHGKSLKLATTHVGDRGAIEVKTATLYCKPWTTLKPDYCEKRTRRWIVFPWEIREVIKLICQTYKSDPTSTKAALVKLEKAGASQKLIRRFSDCATG